MEARTRTSTPRCWPRSRAPCCSHTQRSSASFQHPLAPLTFCETVHPSPPTTIGCLHDTLRSHTRWELYNSRIPEATRVPSAKPLEQRLANPSIRSHGAPGRTVPYDMRLPVFPLQMLDPGRNQVLTASTLASHSSRPALASSVAYKRRSADLVFLSAVSTTGDGWVGSLSTGRLLGVWLLCLCWTASSEGFRRARETSWARVVNDSWPWM